jgi:hypothetical protein
VVLSEVMQAVAAGVQPMMLLLLQLLLVERTLGVLVMPAVLAGRQRALTDALFDERASRQCDDQRYLENMSNVPCIFAAYCNSFLTVWWPLRRPDFGS